MDRREILKFLGGIIPGGAATVVAAPEASEDEMKRLLKERGDTPWVTIPGTAVYQAPQYPPLYVLTIPPEQMALSAEDYERIRQMWDKQFNGNPPPLVVLYQGVTLTCVQRGLGPYSWRERYEEREVEITFGKYEELVAYLKAHVSWYKS